MGSYYAGSTMAGGRGRLPTATHVTGPLVLLTPALVNQGSTIACSEYISYIELFHLVHTFLVY